MTPNPYPYLIFEGSDAARQLREASAAHISESRREVLEACLRGCTVEEYRAMRLRALEPILLFSRRCTPRQQ